MPIIEENQDILIKKEDFFGQYALTQEVLKNNEMQSSNLSMSRLSKASKLESKYVSFINDSRHNSVFNKSYNNEVFFSVLSKPDEQDEKFDRFSNSLTSSLREKPKNSSGSDDSDYNRDSCACKCRLI